MALLDAALKEILVCPCPHHAALTENESESRLECAKCGLGFAVQDGIPVMLLEEAVPTPQWKRDQCGAPEIVAAN